MNTVKNTGVQCLRASITTQAACLHMQLVAHCNAHLTLFSTAIVHHPENINETTDALNTTNMHELLFLPCQTGCEERHAAGCSSQDAAKIVNHNSHI
ncbi:hypothetical protein T4B_2644 [Trichinella pseudospiralis]|uniref:Uncharacterized protein n=2 Tax=Trichinella pseudospiralis TaxID=6337 RepID=A0A0V1JJ15_TRIPS|nr:hypothetical protein T4D_13761 [Trichinella pseudospiralis]KRZ34943.1 hypothetical protein T4B_2644 [Trichinella pseudospiralis]KRZ44099.1 hypothetical protein T4C_369 [Trichinella pseudospiralis]